MLLRSRARAAALVTAAVVGIATSQLDAQSSGRSRGITTPKAQFGFDIGADYQLATYRQLADYWRKLDAESDRLSLVDIGKTAEGRPQLMAIVTAPENHKKLGRYQEIVRRLTLAEGLTDAQARALAIEGKAVVWIDGGLHANEVLGAQQLIETSYRLVSGQDDETRRILRDVVILMVHANPDGHDLVAEWYLREPELRRRSMAGLPRLYQKYIGHDNNRDSYMSTQPESTNMNRVLYREWFPQILYNHHQTGPSGTVLFAPPFRDPFNYVFDPLVPLGIDLVGAAMHQRFVAENKPGATMRRGANYSTWWNGGLRTTAYYHNMIGLLTEAIGHPTPMEIPFVPSRAIASGDLPFPIAPQTWHFRQSIEYEVTANMAVLDVASRYRETFLYNAYLMGKRSIERGSTDTWTVTPRRIDRLRQRLGERDGGVSPATTMGGRLSEVPASFASLLREPADRDPRGYILSAAQRDFPTAIKFANTLMKTGVTVHRATAGFTVNGQTYPAGSIVVKTAQAFRPHVLDMFEPQDHPHDVAYPGGPPIPPYDSAGWTLAFQMGLEFDRVLDAFDGPFERLTTFIEPKATVAPLANAAGYLLSAAENDAARTVNRLLAAGATVARYPQHPAGPGTWFVEGAAATGVVTRAAAELGVTVTPVAAKPAGDSVPIRKARIGLVDEYGGSIPSGWIRWLLEQYEFPFDVVFPPMLDAGSLNARYDVLIVADDLIPEPGRRSAGSSLDAATVPEPYRSQMGRVTVERTVPALQAFLDGGGTIVAIGPSTSLAAHLRLPITSALVTRTATGDRPLKQEEYYIPGSVLRVRVDQSQPLAWGMPAQADVYFDNSPVFRLGPEAAARGVTPIAWFDSAAPLRSGWAWGQHYLEGGVAIAEARVGKGRLVLCGPEITFRAQPHGTFKFLFNALRK
ncbi:MAG: M14 metallopeptidase family protein [Vicinamibacteraceae bacterium]